MAAPGHLDELAGKVFSFYPPIRNIEHNEWEYRRAEWSEMLVANTKSGAEVWIPRRFIGEISSVDEPVVIVGLTRELEYKGGSVWPYGKRVIEMRSFVPPTYPSDAGKEPPAARPHGSASPATESRIGRLIAVVIVTAAVLLLAVIAVFRTAPTRQLKFTAVDQDFLSLNRYDDYHSIVRKLGEPTESHWKSETGEVQYQALWYPKRSYYVVLMGADRPGVRYIGAVDSNWRVLHYIELPNGTTTAAVLRSVGKF